MLVVAGRPLPADPAVMSRVGTSTFALPAVLPSDVVPVASPLLPLVPLVPDDPLAPAVFPTGVPLSSRTLADGAGLMTSAAEVSVVFEVVL